MKKYIYIGIAVIFLLFGLGYFFNFYPNVDRGSDKSDNIYSRNGKLIAKKGQQKFHLGYGQQNIIVGDSKDYQYSFKVNIFNTKLTIPKRKNVKESVENLNGVLGPTVLAPYETSSGYRFIGGRESDMILDYNINNKTTNVLASLNIIGATEAIWSPDKGYFLLNGFDDSGTEGLWLLNKDGNVIKKIEMFKAEFLNENELVGINERGVVKQNISSNNISVINVSTPNGITADRGRIAYWDNKNIYLLINEKLTTLPRKNMKNAKFNNGFLYCQSETEGELIQLSSNKRIVFSIAATDISTFNDDFLVEGGSALWLIDPSISSAQRISKDYIYNVIFSTKKYIYGIENDIMHTFKIN